jgi:hypothetical protein
MRTNTTTLLLSGASETVATVGLWEQSPNIYNAIPRSVRLDIDIRDTVGERRDSVIKTAFDSAAEIAARRKCGVATKTIFAYPPGTGDKKVKSQGFSLPSLLLAFPFPFYYFLPSENRMWVISKGNVRVGKRGAKTGLSFLLSLLFCFLPSTLL